MFVLAPNFAKYQTFLQTACEQLSLTLDQAQQQQLLYYLQQLLLWNKAYNLTAIKDENQALVKHIFDSLSVVPFLYTQNFINLLDVGTGAGLPAVIIAICCPDIHVTAVDSNSKKVRFIKQVVSELGLKNITPMACRIEEHEQTYAAITSRAFASLIDFVTVTQHNLAQNGQILAMKGLLPLDEMQVLTGDWQINSSQLIVPNLDEQRHLIVLKR